MHEGNTLYVSRHHNGFAFSGCTTSSAKSVFNPYLGTAPQCVFTTSSLPRYSVLIMPHYQSQRSASSRLHASRSSGHRSCAVETLCGLRTCSDIILHPQAIANIFITTTSSIWSSLSPAPLQYHDLQGPLDAISESSIFLYRHLRSINLCSLPLQGRCRTPRFFAEFF